MLWSALSAGAAMLTSAGADVQLGPQEKGAWEKLRPSVVTLLKGQRPVGVAALIDSQGLFLAHRSAVAGKTVAGRLASGRTIRMTLKGTDATTQLAVLDVPGWDEDARPLRAPLGTPVPSTKLIAALPTGPIRAELAMGGRLGMLAGTRRLMPVNEVRFEAPQSAVGGALVMTFDGQVVGFLQATLGSEKEPTDQPAEKGARAPRKAAEDASARTEALPAAAFSNLGSPARFGPAEMTVAYTVGSSVLRRVIDNFKRGATAVAHPTIGVQVKDAPESDGALIHTVTKGGSAEEAGLRPGDVIYQIGGRQIRNQLDLALVVMEQQVGTDLVVRVRRGRSRLSVPLRVGSQTPASDGNPESATSA